MKNFESSHVAKVETENTGGGCMVDMIYLDTGHVISVNEECLCVHTGINDFYEQRSNTVSIHFDEVDEADREHKIACTAELQAPLVDLLRIWCQQNNLPNWSADELLATDISTEQTAWLHCFMTMWHAAEHR